MSSQQILLFHSPRCKYCQNIISMIETTDINPKYINIHELKERPKFLKEVPTLLAPDTTTIFNGKKAFEYVQNQLLFRIPTNNYNVAKHIHHNDKSELLKNTNEKVKAFAENDYGTPLSHSTLLDLEDGNRNMH